MAVLQPFPCFAAGRDNTGISRTQGKKMNRILPVLGIGALIWLVFQNIADKISEDVNVERIKVKIEAVNWAALSVRLKITFFLLNTSPVAIPFNSFFGQLLYGSTYLAYIQTYNNKVLPIGQVVPVDLIADVDIARVGGDVAALIQSGQFLQSLRVKGLVHVGAGLKFEIDQPLQVI